MTSEAKLEKRVMDALQALGYQYLDCHNESDLLRHLKTELERLNQCRYSDDEFKSILNLLRNGNIFAKAERLRQRQHQYQRDDGKTGYFMLIDRYNLKNNQLTVLNQFTNKQIHTQNKNGKKAINRYDVTILLNGLPVIQIELKKAGIEMGEAFNQVKRYQQDSYQSGIGLFQYLQLIIISNKANTRYFANNELKHLNFNFTFNWTDRENRRINDIFPFIETFLAPDFIIDYLDRYIVLHQSSKALMALRPYQYYATRAIVEQVETSDDYGYIWHTTGSGKTLTSFKTSQILSQTEGIEKVIFVVDRKDLDSQTTKEYNAFSDGAIDGTGNTKMLIEQLNNRHDGGIDEDSAMSSAIASTNNLIVTTIQKLSSAIRQGGQTINHRITNRALKERKVVLIFDECHRSQFGDMHKDIKTYFEKAQMFGFTGTPIFPDNAMKVGKREMITKDLFGECLHQYLIHNAIHDGNALPFAVDYYDSFDYRPKDDEGEQVNRIDTREVFAYPERLEAIANHIIKIHPHKASWRGKNHPFSAIFAVDSIKMLNAYYDIFKVKKAAGEHNLTIGAIYSFNPNDDFGDTDDSDEIPTNSAEKLRAIINDYNQLQGSYYTLQTFDGYNNAISANLKRLPEAEQNQNIDILLVVNMFLTGFDSRYINTLYVDKNLKHHGLIQAYSRTNRIYTDAKRHGNIVAYRNLKEATDKAVALFSDGEQTEALSTVILKEYSYYFEQFRASLNGLLEEFPTPQDVDLLMGEKALERFVKSFRAILGQYNHLRTYEDFSFTDLPMSEAIFNEYVSKYRDLYTKREKGDGGDSIIDDLDFKISLIVSDEINVDYIVDLLAGKIIQANRDDLGFELNQPLDESAIKEILDQIDQADDNLRSKRDLIEKFIREELLKYDPKQLSRTMVDQKLKTFSDEEESRHIEQFAKERNLNLDPEKLKQYIQDRRDGYPITDLMTVMNERPSLLEYPEITKALEAMIEAFAERYF